MSKMKDELEQLEIDRIEEAEEDHYFDNVIRPHEENEQRRTIREDAE